MGKITAYLDAKNAKQYVERAHDFIKNPPSGTLEKVRETGCKIGAPGDKLMFHPKTDTFLVATKDGIPRSMYVPAPKNGRSSLQYFLDSE